jgi:hypothetical protein
MNTAREPSSEDGFISQDLIRIGERILDQQVKILLDRFDRTDRLVRLAVATLAGMVAVSSQPLLLYSEGPSMRRTALTDHKENLPKGEKEPWEIRKARAIKGTRGFKTVLGTPRDKKFLKELMEKR